MNDKTLDATVTIGELIHRRAKQHITRTLHIELRPADATRGPQFLAQMRSGTGTPTGLYGWGDTVEEAVQALAKHITETPDP